MQMSIFDYIPPKPGLFGGMDEQGLADYFGAALGARFTYSRFMEQWKAKIGAVKLDFSLSTYDTSDERDGRPVILVGYVVGKTGGGKACDTVTEALEYFRKISTHGNDDPEIKRRRGHGKK